MKWAIQFERPRRVSAPPQLHFETPEVSGALSADLAQQAMRRRFGIFRLCYEQALSDRKDLEGTVWVTFQVSADGKVFDAAVDQTSSLSDRKMTGCVRRAMAETQFPAPERGNVKIRAGISFAKG